MDEELKGDWEESEEKLQLKLELKDFSSCIELMDKIAELAEEQNHHPDICVSDYNNIKITITTHDKGKVTGKDYQLARSIDEIR